MGRITTQPLIAQLHFLLERKGLSRGYFSSPVRRFDTIGIPEVFLQKSRLRMVGGGWGGAGLGFGTYPGPTGLGSAAWVQSRGGGYQAGAGALSALSSEELMRWGDGLAMWCCPQGWADTQTQVPNP